MKSKINIPPLVLGIPATTVLLLFSYIGTYSRFMADDFCSIDDAHRYKMLRYIWHWYTTWGGRYSSIAADELLVYIGPSGVRFLAIVVLSVWAIVITFTLQTFFAKFIDRNITIAESLSASLIALFALISVSPGVQTVFYWWNGMRTYIPPLIVFTLSLGYLHWSGEKINDKKRLVAATLFGFLITLFSGGFNETFTFIQFLFFTGFTCFIILVKKFRLTDSILRLIISLGLGALTALIIMAVSPGAEKRQNLFPPHPGIIQMLDMIIRGYFKYISEILTSLQKLSAILTLVLTGMWLGTKSKQKPANKSLILLALASGVALCLVSLFPSVYGMAQLPASRTYIVPSFILIASLFCAGIMTGTWFSNSTTYSKSILISAIAFTLFSTGINTQALYQNRAPYINYAALYDRVETMVKQAHSNGDQLITIPALDNWAHLDRPNDVARFWPTACYSEFYGIQVIGPP